MKKIDSNKLPAISGANQRPLRAVSSDALKTSGVPFATYGVRQGDVIEFPDSWDDVQTFEQEVRKNSGIFQNVIVVLRNNKPDYLSLGSLRKQDVNREYTCDFTKQMGEMNSDYDRIDALLGKKITAKSMKTINVQAFDRLTGERLEGQTRTQSVPVIEYA